MPKVHKVANQDTSFAVSPWQSKKERHTQAPTAPNYSEVVVELPAFSEHNTVDVSQQALAATYKERSAPQPSAWRRRRRGDAGAVQSAQDDRSMLELPEPEEPCGEADEPAPAPGRPPSAQVISGLGYVAVLSDGQCVGDLTLLHT